MRVVVYPRLHQVLVSRGRTLDDLEARIKERFGSSVDMTALYWLMLEDEPVRRVNMESVAAAAVILEAPLAGFFDIRIVSHDTDHERTPRILGATDSRRLADLLDKASLSDAEQAELDALVSKYGRTLRDRRIAERAKVEGRAVEQVRRESDAEIGRTLDWLRGSDDSDEHLTGAIEQRLAR